MNKEEILERSRKENKNQDIYEKEVIIQGNRYAYIAAGVLATIFFVIQIFTGGDMNYRLYAVVFFNANGRILDKIYKNAYKA